MKTKALDKTSSQELDKAVFEAFTAFANRSDEITRSGRAKLLTYEGGKHRIVKEGFKGWTAQNTEDSREAEAGGIAIDKKTGQPITWDELEKISQEGERIRELQGDEAQEKFLEERIGSSPMDLKPFNF